MQSPNDRNYRALRALFFVCTSLFAMIIGRLFFIQIYVGSRFFEHKTLKRRLKHTSLAAERGTIRDRKGRILATNTTMFDLVWQSSGRKTLSAEQKKLYEKIKEKTDGTEQLPSLKKIVRSERTGRDLLLASHIDFATMSMISESCSALQNLKIIPRTKRIYPHTQTACHVIGSVRNNKGMSGVEQLCDALLSGKAGRETHEINAQGKKLEQHAQNPAQTGSDVQLTIDLELQKIAQDCYTKNNPGESGAFILMDPTNGHLLVQLSLPQFDPSLFLAPLSQKEWDKQCAGNQPFLNRTIQAVYPPASLFKLVTFAAGIEEQIIAPQTEFECTGYTTLANQRFYCMRHWGHGRLSAQNSLSCSCNIPCYEIGKQIGIDTLAWYAEQFGLGRSTGFVFQDQKGLVPNRAWKQALKNENWWQGETLSAVIGQSFLQATPLQITRMIASIFTGKLVCPRIILHDKIAEQVRGEALPETEPIQVSRATRRFLQASMHAAAQTGTARRFKNLKDFSIYAKTGTAQTSSLQTRKTERRHKEHGWFACLFKYKKERPLMMVVLVEHTGRSEPALRSAYSFLERYAKLARKN